MENPKRRLQTATPQLDVRYPLFDLLALGAFGGSSTLLKAQLLVAQGGAEVQKFHHSVAVAVQGGESKCDLLEAFALSRASDCSEAFLLYIEAINNC